MYVYVRICTYKTYITRIEHICMLPENYLQKKRLSTSIQLELSVESNVGPAQIFVYGRVISAF
jgi:hypothetical protein